MRMESAAACPPAARTTLLPTKPREHSFPKDAARLRQDGRLIEVAEVGFFPDENRRALAIAAVVTNGKPFETALHFLLNGFTFADPDDDRRAKTGMAGTQLKLLAKTVKRASLRSVTRDRILAWVEDAYSAADRRNARRAPSILYRRGWASWPTQQGNPGTIGRVVYRILNLTISALRKAVEDGGRLT